MTLNWKWGIIIYPRKYNKIITSTDTSLSFLLEKYQLSGLSERFVNQDRIYEFVIILIIFRDWKNKPIPILNLLNQEQYTQQTLIPSRVCSQPLNMRHAFFISC